MDDLDQKVLNARVMRARQKRQKINPATAFAGGFNQTAIDIAGFPVDLVNKGLSLIGLGSDIPFGGSEQLTNIARNAGMVKGEGVKETGAERAGKITAASLPMFGLVGGLARANKTGGVLAPMVESFARKPVAITAQEGASVAGAAVGGEVGREFGDNGAIIGEIIGGITTPTAIAVSSKIPTLRLLKKATQPFRQGGSRKIAAQVAQGVVDDPKLTALEANKFQALPGTKFTVGEMAADPQLIALERAVAKKVPDLADDMLKNKSATNQAIRNAVKNFNEGSGNTVGAAEEHFHAITTRLKNALNARMAGAVKRSKDAINKIRPSGERPDISRIINSELEDALSDARGQERVIWDNLNPKEPVVISSAKEMIDDFVSKESDLPSFVREFLEFKGQKMMDFGDVKRFRTRLLRQQRAARSAGNANLAWDLGRINEGILDDISRSALSDEFHIAVDFSRELNTRFTRGRIGKALRFAPSGGRVVTPEMMSEELFPPNAARSTEGLNAFAQATDAMPGAVPRATQQSRAMESVAQLIRSRLFKGTGQFDKTAARQMIEKKDEFLNRFPELKNQISEAVKSEDAQRALAKRVAKAKANITDRRKSAIGLITNGREDEFMGSILRSPKRQKLLSQIVRSTKGKDDLAFQGIQDAYMDEAFKRSLTGSLDESGERYISGNKLSEFLSATRKDVAASGLFDKDELKRLDIIVDNAKRLETVSATERSIDDALEVNMLEDFLVRVMGANLGAKFAGGGMGAPIVAAGAGSKVMRKIVEGLPQKSVVKVLSEAVRDGDMMNLLLEDVTPALAQRQLVRMHAWLGALGIELPDIVSDIEEMEK